MKVIQWYPGHMAKAMRMMEENLSLADGAIFVLDARCPASSYNAKLDALLNRKPVLFVLNKRDMADAGASERLIAAIRASGKKAVFCDALSSASVRAVAGGAWELVREKAEARLSKGNARPMRFLVAGVPNTGKSTLINALAGAKKAQTGDKAGVTRAKQWVKCGQFELLDTPGTMPPACENQTLAMRLAFAGGINDDILAMDEVALSLLEFLRSKYPMSLKERYGRDEGTPLELLEGVCEKRGFFLKRGEYDYERGERAVVDDFRKGKLGKITLDSEEDLSLAGLI